MLEKLEYDLVAFLSYFFQRYLLVAIVPITIIAMVKDIATSRKAAIRNWLESLFSFRGRAGREEYTIIIFSSIAVSTLLIFLGKLLSQRFSFDHIFFAAPGVILFIWIFMAGIIKRFHDLGRAGWWVAMLFILFGVSGVFRAQLWTEIGAAFDLAGLALFMLLFLVPGTGGNNHFGIRHASKIGRGRQRAESAEDHTVPADPDAPRPGNQSFAIAAGQGEYRGYSYTVHGDGAVVAAYENDVATWRNETEFKSWVDRSLVPAVGPAPG